MKDPISHTKQNVLSEEDSDDRLLELSSLEEIPEFDHAEQEARFWKSHHISKEILDQVPNPPEDEE